MLTHSVLNPMSEVLYYSHFTGRWNPRVEGPWESSVGQCLAGGISYLTLGYSDLGGLRWGSDAPTSKKLHGGSSDWVWARFENRPNESTSPTTVWITAPASPAKGCADTGWVPLSEVAPRPSCLRGTWGLTGENVSS